MSKVRDILLYGNNMTLLNEEKTHVVPCLKPTKGGHVILRNDVQRKLKHTKQLVPTVGKGTFSTEVLDELMFTLSLTLS